MIITNIHQILYTYSKPTINGGGGQNKQGVWQISKINYRGAQNKRGGVKMQAYRKQHLDMSVFMKC